MTGVAYDFAPGVQVLIGRSSDKDGIDTGGIETGVMETGVIEILIPWRGDGATVVAEENVTLGCCAEQASRSEKPKREVESLMLAQKGQ